MKIKKLIVITALISIVFTSERNVVYAFETEQNPSILGADSEEVEIPIEVKNRIKELKRANPHSQITLDYSDERTVSESPKKGAASLNSTGSSWGKFRTYKKMRMRDFLVTTRNAFDMRDIKKGSGASKTLSALVLYCGSAAIDKIIPFGSAAVTAVQFCAENSYKYSANGGDKLQAAPQYTTTEKFTYVYIGDQPFLGAKTYSSKIETISWYLYSAKKHKQFSKVATYNKTCRSTNYANPDKKAIVYYADGGFIDQCIRLKIKDATFYLK